MSFRVVKSYRARRMRIAVYSNSNVVLTVPNALDFALARNFVKEKYGWILKSLEYFSHFSPRPNIKSGKREFLKNKTAAQNLAEAKVEEWNKFYNFSVNRVNIKNQKTRWGSCSKKGNLNFNYKIAYLPENLLDYLVVHELCHLREFNHGKSFWSLVGLTIPDYKTLRQQLRNFRIKI